MPGECLVYSSALVTIICAQLYICLATWVGYVLQSEIYACVKLDRHRQYEQDDQKPALCIFHGSRESDEHASTVE